MFYSLSQRVEDIEHISSSINSKISVVLTKLEAMEQDETKKKEHMSKLMDDFVEGNDMDDMDDDMDEMNDLDNMDSMDEMDDMDDMED